jgi:serine/threonine protein kinase
LEREPGTILDGKYEIVQRLGSGGMGEVYLARHLHLHELRVIKILRQDLARDPSAQKRFMREARLATQIKHPNVAILYDFSTLDETSFYMVWEHIQGQDVGDRIRQHGHFPVTAAIQLAIQALRGLEALHAIGVVHRDISPDNLMIEDRKGQHQIKIIDLGLAKTLEPDANYEVTQVGMFMGKLRYCSPEQAGAVSGESIDLRSDLYSFGLVLYEMVAGLPPFDSENPHGFIFKRLSEDPLPLKGRNPQVVVPPELDRVVLRSLERDREKRFADAAAFIEALEGVLRSMSAAATQEIQLPPLSGPPRLAGPPRTRSSSELTREDRAELLAQIERAGRRAKETSTELSRAEAALAAGRLDEARDLIGKIESVNPRASGLQSLKERMAELQRQMDFQRRIGEAEQVLKNYIHRKQIPLARLALETLLELQPEHPGKAEFEQGIANLLQETDRDKRAAEALAHGRAALARRDFRAARRELDVLSRNDPTGQRANLFRAEVESAEQEGQLATQADISRRRIEYLLSQNLFDEAEAELAQLTKVETTRVTLDFYRERLTSARRNADIEQRSAPFEARYHQAINTRDWFTAREVALELGKAVPDSPRAANMFSEVERLESIHRKQQSVEQGVRQVEAFISQGDAARAELALKILLQMDPENHNRRRLEKEIQGISRSG